jgi:hypothetical protein
MREYGRQPLSSCVIGWAKTRMRARRRLRNDSHASVPSRGDVGDVTEV